MTNLGQGFISTADAIEAWEKNCRIATESLERLVDLKKALQEIRGVREREEASEELADARRDFVRASSTQTHAARLLKKIGCSFDSDSCKVECPDPAPQFTAPLPGEPGCTPSPYPTSPRMPYPRPIRIPLPGETLPQRTFQTAVLPGEPTEEAPSPYPSGTRQPFPTKPIKIPLPGDKPPRRTFQTAMLPGEPGGALTTKPLWGNWEATQPMTPTPTTLKLPGFMPGGAQTLAPGALQGPPGFTKGLGSPSLGQLDANEIRDLIDRLPAGEAENYLKRLEGCIELIAAGGLTGIVGGYKCLDSLYDDVRAAVKAYEAGDKPTTVTTTTTTDKELTKDEGISPWAIAGGLAAAGLLGYLALK